jgi:hypothetical protein
MFVNRNFDRVTRISLAVVIASTACFTTNKSEAADGYVPFSGVKTAWHEGFDRYDFVMDDATGAITPMVPPASEIKDFNADRTLKDGKRRCVGPTHGTHRTNGCGPAADGEGERGLPTTHDSPSMRMQTACIRASDELLTTQEAFSFGSPKPGRKELSMRRSVSREN